MSGVGRLVLRSHAHHGRGADLRRAAGPRRVFFEAADAELEEAFPPARSLLDADSELFGVSLFCLPLGGEQLDPRPLDHAGWQRTRTAALLQDFSLLRIQFNSWRDTHAGDL